MTSSSGKADPHMELAGYLPHSSSIPSAQAHTLDTHAHKNTRLFTEEDEKKLEKGQKMKVKTDQINKMNGR